MLVFRIIGTILIAFSFMTTFLKNIIFFQDSENDVKLVIGWTLYGWLWRTFVITAIWLI